MTIELIPLTHNYSIYKIESLDEIQKIETKGCFISITSTDEEISIVCKSGLLNNYLKCEPDWKGFKVKGMLDFSLVGIIHEITRPLQENNISVFVVSTFNTDYFFVKASSMLQTTEIFSNSKGFKVVD